MIDALTVYILSQAFILFWFYSPLKLSLYYLINKQEIFDTDKFDLFLLSKSKWFKVLTCTFCLGFWASIVLSFIFSHTTKGFLINAATSVVLLFLYEQVVNFLKRVDK